MATAHSSGNRPLRDVDRFVTSMVAAQQYLYSIYLDYVQVSLPAITDMIHFWYFDCLRKRHRVPLSYHGVEPRK